MLVPPLPLLYFSLSRSCHPSAPPCLCPRPIRSLPSAAAAAGGVGASFSFTGALVASPAAGQAVELQAVHADVLGGVDPAVYPLSKKKHSMEFLRENAHLRARTNIG